MKKMLEGWVRTMTLAAALAAGTAVLADAPAEAQHDQESAEAAPEGVVNLNTANAQELARLPGIGQSKAEAIVTLRDRRGPFQRVEQVMLVRGIGRATFRRLRPMLTLEGPTTLGAQQR